MTHLLTPSDYVVILSDLHLADGYRHELGEFAPAEMFFDDKAFEDFLNHLRWQSAQYQCKCTLVILGDMLDFLHVRKTQAPYYKLDISESLTKNKLTQIINGHQQFFKALVAFAVDGFSIHIVPGNHDIEFVIPSIQDNFKQYLLELGASNKALENICFFPWIYYIPSLIYAEHGHQYHDINAFHSMLQFVAADTTNIKHPPGAYLDEYFFNKRKLGANYQTLPIWHHLYFIVTLLAILLQRLFTIHPYQPQTNLTLGVYPDSQLSQDVLMSIDRLTAFSPVPMVLRLMKKLLAGNHISVSSIIYKRVQAIDMILRENNMDVPFYVFAHTHHADKRPLSQNEEQPMYLNTGTWARNLADISDESERFTFVEVRRDKASGTTQARLLRWSKPDGVAHEYTLS